MLNSRHTFIAGLFALACVIVFHVEGSSLSGQPAAGTLLTVFGFALISIASGGDGMRVSTGVYALFFIGGIAAVRANLNAADLSLVIRPAASHFLLDLVCGLGGAALIRELAPHKPADGMQQLVETISSRGSELQQAITGMFSEQISEAVSGCSRALDTLGTSVAGPVAQISQLKNQLDQTISSMNEWDSSVRELHGVLDEFVNKVVPLIERMAEERKAA